MARKKTIYLLVNAFPYEGIAVIRSYASMDSANTACDKARLARERWEKKQRRLEELGDDEAWLGNAPGLQHPEVWPVRHIEDKEEA
jgi:hypothetical protein